MSSPIPTLLRTKRLQLRPWLPEDAPSVAPVLAANVSHLHRWIPAHVAAPAALPALVERLTGFAADFAAGRSFRLAVLSRESGDILGEADLFPRSAAGRVPLGSADHIELGYWLAASATGRGYATEAAGALLEVASSIPGLSHVEIHCAEANAPSAAIPLRLGFLLASVERGQQIWRKELARPGRVGV